MAKESQLLTTGEFASRAGIATSSVSKLIREGKIKAEKKSGKWMIRPDQLDAKALQEPAKKGKTAPQKKTAKAAARTKKSASPAKEKPGAKAPAGGGKAYTMAEFVAMTYLTEKGVQQWLRQGRLSGRQDDQGQWLIDAANLEAADVKRLVRQA